MENDTAKKIISRVLENILADQVMTEQERRMLRAFELGTKPGDVKRLIIEKGHELNMPNELIRKAIDQYEKGFFYPEKDLANTFC